MQSLSRDLQFRLMNNFRFFNANLKLQQAVLTLMVNQLIADEEMEDQKKMFARLDTNQDGVLQKDEIISGFKDIYGEVDNNEIDDLMLLTDFNNNGDIDYFEWLASTVESSVITHSTKLRMAFQYFDLDNTGKISLQNIKKIMGSGGLS